MTAFVDTNVLVRYLTGDPPGQAELATRYLEETTDLRVLDLIVAEVVYVLESFYKTPRQQLAESLRELLALPSLQVDDRGLLQRTVDLYEGRRLDFADAYLVACAERSGVGVVASFDRGIDRAGTIQREEPS